MQIDENESGTRRKPAGLPLGIASGHPLAPPGDEWWQPMTDEEVEAFIAGE